MPNEPQSLALAWGETVCVTCKETVANVKDQCATCYQRAYRIAHPRPKKARATKTRPISKLDDTAILHLWAITRIVVCHIVGIANEIKNLNQ
jgi:hypothetical protein